MNENMQKKVIKQSVIGKIHSPLGKNYKLTTQGTYEILPSFGGITYNFTLGDSVFNIEGDHVEPNVSIRNEIREENEALNLLSCIGNEAFVISGDMKGAKGYVIGKHGVVDHILVWFSKNTQEKLAINNEIQIISCGQGIKLENFEDIKIMNIDPSLLKKIAIIKDNKTIEVSVSCEVPSYLIGSGIGSDNPYIGDFDIMTDDMNEIKRLKLDTLRIGDIVSINDLDCTNGVGYYRGSKTIGIIVHSDCVKAGHGPGVVPILSTKSAKIKSVVNDANIKNYLEIR